MQYGIEYNYSDLKHHYLKSHCYRKSHVLIRAPRTWGIFGREKEFKIKYAMTSALKCFYKEL